MPSLQNIQVINQNTGATWTNGNLGGIIMDTYVIVSADERHIPPRDFFNDPQHSFIVIGRTLGTREFYTSPAWRPNTCLSAPPYVFALSN